MDAATLALAARAPLSRAETETLFHAIFRGETPSPDAGDSAGRERKRSIPFGGGSIAHAEKNAEGDGLWTRGPGGGGIPILRIEAGAHGQQDE